MLDQKCKVTALQAVLFLPEKWFAMIPGMLWVMLYNYDNISRQYICNLRSVCRFNLFSFLLCLSSIPEHDPHVSFSKSHMRSGYTTFKTQRWGRHFCVQVEDSLSCKRSKAALNGNSMLTKLEYAATFSLPFNQPDHQPIMGFVLIWKPLGKRIFTA